MHGPGATTNNQNNIMKKNDLLSRMFNHGMACLCAAVMLSAGMLSSCSDDDGEGGGGTPSGLETPAYENVSAKYDITSGGNGIKSIELTSGGSYIITYGQGAGTQAYAMAAGNTDDATVTNMMAGKPATRAGETFQTGKFIKISDTEFILEGYGSIVIDGAADNAFSIQVTPSEGETFTVNADKAATMADSEMTNALCRTWSINNVRMTVSLNGGLRFNKTRPVSEYAQLWRDVNTAMAQLEEELTGEPSEGDFFDIPSYTPDEIIFTKAGSYLVTATENYLSMSIWQWYNEGKGVLRYSHNLENINDPAYSGTADISFNGAILNIGETNLDESEEGLSLQIRSYYECSEAE